MLGDSWPLFMLRDLVLLPGAEQTLFVGRPSTVAALEQALATPCSLWPESKKTVSIPSQTDTPANLICVAQRTAKISSISATDLFTIGTTAVVTYVCRMPGDDSFKVILKGEDRAKVFAVCRWHLCPRRSANHS